MNLKKIPEVNPRDLFHAWLGWPLLCVYTVEELILRRRNLDSNAAYAGGGRKVPPALRNNQVGVGLNGVIHSAITIPHDFHIAGYGTSDG